MDKAHLAVVDTFTKGKAERQLQYDLLPQPFMGRKDAPVVILQHNPSWSNEDFTWVTNPLHRKCVFDCLAHKNTKYPFHAIAPDFENSSKDKSKQSPAYRWWKKRIYSLCIEVGKKMGNNNDERWKAGRDIVAKNLLCVEYHAYPSQKKDVQINWLPSQGYSFQLVREAVIRKAIIVICRSAYQWKMAVPELQRYENVAMMRSPQATFITKNNITGLWDDIVHKLQEGI